MRTNVRRTAMAAAVACAVALPAGALSLAPAATAAGEIVVRPDPTYAGDVWEGWGSSLVWSANATGGYPDVVRERLAAMLYGPDGLNLNIARYNIGGGNAPDVPSYMRNGAAVPGWWKAPAGTTRTDKDWWDPANAGHWNWDADPRQRWWIDEIKPYVTHWEAFSNSPPYFQTVSGYVSGGTSGTTDQIRTDTLDDFATYLARVTERLEDAHGITFDTIDPLNEPNTGYWATTIGSDGNPTGGRQEGAHAGPALQSQVISALAAELAKSGTTTDAVISAMDETNPGLFTTNWTSYSEATQAAVAQMNVHTYGTGQRTSVRDLAKGEAKPLWMSEVEGTWGSGLDYTTMDPGIGIAERITSDLRELEPTAWVLWQPIEDVDVATSNWGSIHVPFSCPSNATLTTCPIKTNSKFDTIRNFTHYIRPGDRLIGTNDASTTAAVNAAGTQLKVVYVNSSTSAQTVRLDLSRFGAVSGASVTAVRTSSAGRLVESAPVSFSGTTVDQSVPARSVTTFVVDGVSGVAAAASALQDSHEYRLVGVGSSRALAPAASGSSAVLRTVDTAAAAQRWSVDRVSGTPGSAGSNRSQYTVTNVGSGKRLAIRSGALVLETVSGSADAAARWIPSTTGDGTYTLVNAATSTLVDVVSASTADGAAVDEYKPTSGNNQRWTLVDVGTSANVATLSGASVTATYTESGYSAAALRNGVAAEKAWSNWRSGTKNTSETLTVTLPASRAVTGVKLHFWRDGANTSWAQTVRVETRNSAGTWVAASGEVTVTAGSSGNPVVEVPIAATTTDAVRVVLTPFANGYVTAGELEVHAQP
ncbi:RICIN domain-containing protein [Promicromonospora soli]|nr:RICIN domain-containing protein [Promicromonospora soli]